MQKNRSNQIKSYFIVHEGLKEDHFRTTNSTQRWRGMTDVIAVAYMSPNAKIDTVPDILSERDVVPSDSLPGNGKSENRPESEIPESSVAPDMSDKAPEEMLSVPGRPSYRWAVKTNVAYLAATVANLGVEYSFGDHYSVDLPVIYSPYTVARKYRLRFLAIQPEFRYWLKTPDAGSLLRRPPQYRCLQHRGRQRETLPVARRLLRRGPELRLRTALRPPLGSRVHPRRGICPHKNTTLIIIYRTAPASKRDNPTTTGA